jgi:hypothetical protein
MKKHWPSGRPKFWSSSEAAGAEEQYTHAGSRQVDEEQNISVKLGNTLSAGERGLIVSNDFRLVPGGIEVTNREISPQDLRMSLLFWDKLDWPTNNVLAFEDPDVQILLDEKVLTRSRVHVRRISADDDFGSFMVTSQLDVFKSRELEAPGQWAMAHGPNSPTLLDTHLASTDRALWVELVRAIPVPDANVPYEDVLEFRSRRRDELHELRYALDGIYQGIKAAPDRPLAEQTAFVRIERAAEALRRLTGEAGHRSVYSSLRARIDGDLLLDEVAKPMLEETLKAGVIAAFAGAPLAAIGAGVGIGLTKAFRKARSPKEWEGLPFQYVYNYHRELGWV